MRIGILGAGLAGISLAERLQDDDKIGRIELIEKAPVPGGLARSFRFADAWYDCGPHIIFSKDSQVLDLMVEHLGENVHKLRRSNKVFHDGRFVKYPFENELSALSETDKQYCLSAFLNNPYTEYDPENMLQFLLATFGEGITNLYLRPYNEKIWKYDPAFMDMQMVERIPKPPAEDIIKSAEGVATEGYVHQLYFYYPRSGGIASLVQGFLDRFEEKVSVRLDARVERVEKSGDGWTVSTSGGTTSRYDRVVSTIPIPELIAALGPAVPEDVTRAAGDLKFNSIAICTLRVKRDHLGDNFAIMVPDKRVLFHRLTKLDFLFPPAPDRQTTTLQAEVTFRKGDPLDRTTDRQMIDGVIAGLVRSGFIDGAEDVVAEEVRRFQYAYVIYDLHHRRNTRIVRDYCENELGLFLNGRFGEFLYLNMDAVIRHSIDLSEKMRRSFAAAGGFPAPPPGHTG